MKALLIAKHWPELDATAAGRRTYDILNALQDFEFHSASASNFNKHSDLLVSQNIQCHQIKLNDESFDQFIAELNPDIVIYDRFMIEEQFSWRVKTFCPNAMTILDTSDLHCLRQARNTALHSGEALNLDNELALRERATIQRTDLTIMISNAEMDILKNHFCILSNKLHYYPFVINAENLAVQYPVFSERNHLMMIGNFLHEPNSDAARFMANEIWPLVHKQLPEAQLHIYGAYHSDKHQQLHQPKKNVFLKGRCENALETMAQYKINLAPLRFGAGMKGKVLEGWLTNTATIGSPIAFEAMLFGQNLGFTPSINPNDIAQIIIKTYNNESTFDLITKIGRTQLINHFDENTHNSSLKTKILEHQNSLKANRKLDFYQSMFWQKQMRAEQYMSKWIESKNQLAKLPTAL